MPSRRADLAERARVGLVEAVAEDDHVAVAFAAGSWSASAIVSERSVSSTSSSGGWIVAGDEVADDRVVVLADRRVE